MKGGEGSDINVTRQPTSTYRGRGLKGTTAWLCWPFFLAFFSFFFSSAKRNSRAIFLRPGDPQRPRFRIENSRETFLRASTPFQQLRMCGAGCGRKEMDERRGYKLRNVPLDWEKFWKILNGTFKINNNWRKFLLIARFIYLSLSFSIRIFLFHQGKEFFKK